MLGNGRLRLPKIGDVEVRWSRDLPAAPSSVTVIRDAAGRFFASFVVEVKARPLPETSTECGIDLGLGHFVVMDDGTKIASPRFLRRAEKKLKRAQRDLSRKRKGSGRREKARIRVVPDRAQHDPVVGLPVDLRVVQYRVLRARQTGGLVIVGPAVGEGGAGGEGDPHGRSSDPGPQLDLGKTQR